MRKVEAYCTWVYGPDRGGAALTGEGFPGGSATWETSGA